MKIAKNCTKMAILEANFMIDLIRSNSNPVFGFYGVEIFTRIEAGFKFPCIRTLSLIISSFVFKIIPLKLSIFTLHINGNPELAS